MTTRATVVRFADLPADSPMALLTRRRLIGQKMMVSDIHLKRGFKVATHAHENEQISIILSGRLRFTLGAEGQPDREVHTIEAGGAILLPSHLPHAAEALDDVHVLDLFAPPSAGTGIDQRH